VLDNLTHHGHAIITLDLFPAIIEPGSLSFTQQTILWLAADAKGAYSAENLLANAPILCLWQ
jgi:hypothetical protein